MDTLFSDPFPNITDDQALEKVFAQFSEYDKYYIASGCIKDRRDKFDKLWAVHKPYADRHFISQTKIAFHKRTWEMYMTNVCLGNSLNISSSDEGPDLVVNGGIYLECVASSQGNSLLNSHAVPDQILNCTQDVPEEQMILRMTSSIGDKLEIYQNTRSKKEWFDDKYPFIIALNTGDLKFSQNPLIPLILKALFGIGYYTIPLDKSKSPFRSLRTSVLKGEEKIPSMLLEDPTYADVSAIIWSPRMVIDHPDNIGDDCILVHNPNAKNPISLDVFNFMDQWVAIGDQLICHKAP